MRFSLPWQKGMRFLPVCFLLISALLANPIRVAGETGENIQSPAEVEKSLSGQPSKSGSAPPLAKSVPVEVQTRHIQPAKGELQEPDFAFITGGPYTQKKNSLQLISATQWGRRNTRLGGTLLQHAEFGSILRTEWGLTDRWELDFIVSAEGEKHHLGEQQLRSTFGLADSVLGVRYRLLRETNAPFTLTTGPQVIFPSGSLARGTGFGKTGYAWDVTAAKDWGGPFYLYMSLNYAGTPAVRAPLSDSSSVFSLHNLSWANALVFRGLEKPTGGQHHNIHLFAEFALAREDGLEANGQVIRTTDMLSVVAPGIRYGFMSQSQDLFEIGISVPIGLTDKTARHGIIIQFQVEHLFRRLVK